MLWLETVQLMHRDAEVDKAVADPDSGAITPEEQQSLKKAILESPAASRTLKRALDVNYQSPLRTIPRRKMEPPPPEKEPDPPPPPYRMLQVYAFDPSMSGQFETFAGSKVTVELPWEELQAGPAGEYLEVIDHDPASGCFYAPVNLDHPHLLATDGLPPSLGDPQFHEQMTYAVAMRTIRHFELALGRSSSGRLQ
jgi:hypothetical protein